MTPRATTRPATGTINLQQFAAPLPPVTLLNGTTHQLTYTAAAAELYKQVRGFLFDAMNGIEVDERAATDAIDACLALVLSTASPDDLASFGERTELKLSVLAAAAGRVDDVLAEFAAHEPQGNATAGKRSPRSPRGTNSAT